MARQPRTPGATTEAPKTTEVAAPTTAQQSDDVLNEILGTPDSKDAETTASTEPTGTASEPVAQHVPASGADSSLIEILETQKRIESKLDQLLASSGIEAPKKKRWVQGKNGLEHKEA